MVQDITQSILETEYTSSAILSLIFVLCLVYLCYEQTAASRYPQNVIVFVLALGMFCRSIWFFGAANYQRGLLAFEFLNRIAILCQFTAMSLLIEMWTRIGRHGTRNEGMKYSDRANVESTDLKQKQKRNKTNAPTSIFYLFGINLVVWIIIFVTLGLSNGRKNELYTYSIVCLASACFIEAVWVLFIGLQTAIRIDKRIQTNAIDVSENIDSKGSWSSVVSFLKESYALITSKTNPRASSSVQRDGARQMVIFVCIVALFNFERCIVIIYIEFTVK